VEKEQSFCVVIAKIRDIANPNIKKQIGPIIKGNVSAYKKKESIISLTNIKQDVNCFNF
jgi:hypothetical protein